MLVAVIVVVNPTTFMRNTKMTEDTNNIWVCDSCNDEYSYDVLDPEECANCHMSLCEICSDDHEDECESEDVEDDETVKDE